MPVRRFYDYDLPPKPHFDVDKVAQVAVFVVGAAVVGLVLAYR